MANPKEKPAAARPVKPKKLLGLKVPSIRMPQQDLIRPADEIIGISDIDQIDQIDLIKDQPPEISFTETIVNQVPSELSSSNLVQIEPSSISLEPIEPSPIRTKPAQSPIKKPD